MDSDWTVSKELEELSIVVLGSFNPRIYHPQWFAYNNLIRPQEAETAEIDVMTNDIAIVNCSWFKLQVMNDRFEISCVEPAMYAPFKDLVLGTFRILEHTPVSALGMNAHAHYRIASEEAWHAFGHFFAPKHGWQDFLSQPGLRSLSVQGVLTNSQAKYVVMKVEPSVRLKPGIYFYVNRHFEFEGADSESQRRHDALLETLQKEWDDYIEMLPRESRRLIDVAKEGTHEGK